MKKHGKHARWTGESAFTLIELMIVVAIIGILAALAIPKFGLMVERSRESTTRASLASIRSAVSLYEADNDGRAPLSIETAGSAFSRYLDSIPPVKASHSGVGAGISESPSGTSVLYTTDELITAMGTGWRYNPRNGHLFVNSSVTDSKGISYSTYGY